MSNIEGSTSRLIRWFTPTVEIDLCGHATVATSYVLFQKNPSEQTIKYLSKWGLELDCRRESDGQLTLNFPSQPATQLFPKMHTSWFPQLTESAFGEELSKKVVDYQLSAKAKKLLLRLDDSVPEEEFAKISPNFNDMGAVDPGHQLEAVVVTQKSNFEKTGVHFRSRCFGPWLGVNEDPVTGSSFTVLTPYWTQVYAQLSGVPAVFRSLQDSKRGGIVQSRLVGDRVFISGSAVTFSRGSIPL